MYMFMIFFTEYSEYDYLFTYENYSHIHNYYTQYSVMIYGESACSFKYTFDFPDPTIQRGQYIGT